jgi:thiol-disulfide isomerase/thioredoxin
MKNRILLFLTISLFILMSLSIGTSRAGTWEVKKLATSDRGVFVLNQSTRTVSIYNSQLQKTGSFEVVTPLSCCLPMPSDICFDNGLLYVAEKTMHQIFIYSEQGEFLKYLGGIGEFLRAPTAVFVKNKVVYIGDIGCLIVCSDSGNLINRIALHEDANGAPVIVSDICEDRGVIILANQSNSTILTLGKALELGGFGSETGRFEQIRGIASNGNLFVADPSLGKIEQKHPLFNHFVEVPKEDKNQHPTDLTWFQGKLLTVDAMNTELAYVGANNSTMKDPMGTTATTLEMGTIAPNQGKGYTFSVFSKTGFPLSGKVTVDNPLFRIEPNQWNGVVQKFSVFINSKYYTSDTPEKGIITLELLSGEKLTITVKLQLGNKQDFALSFDSNVISFQKNQIAMNFFPQNGISGQIECSIKAQDVPFVFEWDKPTLKIDPTKDTPVMLKISPINKPDPGFYTVSYQIKAVSQKIIKQGTLTFLYLGIENTVSGSILGELFTTDWCPFCPSAHRAMPELTKLYGNMFPILTYYIDCSDASPQRLCFPEEIDRKNWYLPQGTPTLILNGTVTKNGGYKSPTETMTKDYKEMIDQVLPNASPLSLSGSAQFDPVSRLFTIGVQGLWLQKRSLVDPRLYVAICENKIEYVAKNKETIHDYVVRQFLALPNPEKSSAFGTQLLEDTLSVHLEETLDPVINPANMYCVIFVQDNTTKQVLQSQIVPINQQVVSDFDLYPLQSDVLYRKSKIFSAWFTLTNRGNQIEHFTLTAPDNALLPEDSLFVVNGNEYSTKQMVSVALSPNESVLVEIKSAKPIDEAKLTLITLRATNQSETVSKTASLPIRFVAENAPRYEIIYPKEGKLNAGADQCILIKTEPGTKTNLNNMVAGVDGILTIAIPNCPGDSELKFDLLYPNQATEPISLAVTRSLLMILTIGSTKVKTNDLIQTIEAPPYIKNGRTMVPIRIIAEAFCCTVDYDPLRGRITIQSQEKSITLTIGYDMVMVNGKTVKLDAPPEIKNGRTFLPLRFIVEMFGAKIEWNAKLGEIQIKI